MPNWKLASRKPYQTQPSKSASFSFQICCECGYVVNEGVRLSSEMTNWGRRQLPHVKHEKRDVIKFVQFFKRGGHL